MVGQIWQFVCQNRRVLALVVDVRVGDAEGSCAVVCKGQHIRGLVVVG